MGRRRRKGHSIEWAQWFGWEWLWLLDKMRVQRAESSMRSWRCRATDWTCCVFCWILGALVHSEPGGGSGGSMGFGRQHSSHQELRSSNSLVSDPEEDFLRQVINLAYKLFSLLPLTYYNKSVWLVTVLNMIIAIILEEETNNPLC